MAMTREQLLQAFGALANTQALRRQEEQKKVAPQVLKPVVKPIWNESKVPVTPQLQQRNLDIANKFVSTTPGAFAYGVARGVSMPVTAAAKLMGYQESPEEAAVRTLAESKRLTAQMDASKGMGQPNIIQGHSIAPEMVGRVAGSILPFSAAESAVGQALPRIAGAGIKNTALRGAVSGGALQGLEEAGQGKRGMELAGSVALGTALGAAADIGLGYLAKALKAGRPIREVLAEPETLAQVKAELNLPESAPIEQVEQAVNKVVVNRSDVKRVQKPQEPILTPRQPTTPTINKNASEAVTAPSEAPVTWANLDMDAPSPPKEYEVYVPGVTPEGGQKVRKTISNSALGYEMVPDASKAQFAEEIAEGKHTYQATTNIKDYTNAQARVSEDYNTALSDFYKLETLRSADDTALAEALASQAYQNGDNATGHDVLSRLAEMATKAGQSVQAIAILKRMSPEGMLYYANRQIKNAVEKIKKSKPELVGQIDKQADELSKQFDKIDENAAEQAIKEAIEPKQPGPSLGKAPKKPKVESTPGEQLAKRIINSQKPKTPAEVDMVKQMINELFGVAKASPLPTLPGNIETPAVAKLSDAIKNRQTYAETWNEAKQIVMAEYKDADKATKDALQAYFDKGIKPPFQIKTLDSAIKQGLKETNANMDDIARRYYKEGRKSVESLKSYLVRESGLSDADAQYLADRIEKRVHVLAKEQKERLAKRMFGDKPKAKPPQTGADKIEVASNLGLFVNQNYAGKVLEKLTPAIRTAIKDAGITLDELVRLGASKQQDVKEMFAVDILSKINVPPSQYDVILDKATEVFETLSESKRQSILKKMFEVKKRPEVKPMAQQVYELINLGAFDNKAIRQALYEKKGIPTLSREEQDYIVETMQKAVKLKEGRQKDILMGQINQVIADKIPADTGEKIAAGLRVSMLLNPKTLVTRNPLGNVIFGGLENIKQVPATLADTALSKVTGKRTTTLPALGAQAKGTVKGIKEATEDIKYNIDTAISRGGVELPNSKKIFDESRPGGKTLNTLHNWMGNALKYGDRPFYEAAKDARLAELKKLGSKTGMTPEEMEAAAIEEGLSRTFQNQGQTAKQIQSLKKGLGPLMGQAAMPFVTTPANIIAKGIEYTPLGIVKLFNEAVTKPRQFKGFDQKAFVDTLGRTMTGTAIALTGYNLAKEGHITGGPSKNTDVSGLNKVTGEQNYAINFGDGSYTFDWAQPAAIPLAIGVDFYQSGKDKESLPEAMAAGLTGAGNTLLNMSVLNGMNQMFRGYSPAEGIATTALGTPLQALPTLGSQIAAYSDENQRQYDSGIVGGLKSKAMAKIPVVRQQMPPKIGITGEPLKQFQGRQGIARVAEAFLSPGFYAKKTDDPTLKEIQSVYKSTGVTGVIPSVAPKSFKSGGETVKLDAKAQAEFQRLQGTEAIRRIQEYISSPGWNDMTDEEKAKYLKKAVDKAYDMAKEQTLKQ